MRRLLAMHLSSIALLAACSSGPEGVQRFDPGKPDRAQQERLANAERLYRTSDPAFAAERDALSAEPVTAFWLTRMLVRDIVHVREGRDPDQEFQRAAASITNPVEARAMTQLVAMGEAAMPCIRKDLLESRQGPLRELGVETSARIGAAAVPDLAELVRSGDANQARGAVRALAAMEVCEPALELLREAARSADFTLRAAAARGLVRGSIADVALVRAMVVEDGDRFVRRTAGTAISTVPEVRNAEALVTQLRRCLAEQDTAGEQAAQEALQRLSNTRSPRTADAWAEWARTWTPQGASRQ
ncbi:MAG: hypothetical protein RL148_398 [Planctomycetota bacterium]|jgi:hypothetical protein